MIISNLIKKELKAKASQQRARGAQRYFKTGPGEYGEGDIFIGVDSSNQRVIAKKYFQKATLTDTAALIKSKIHEERQTALLILVLKYQKAKEEERTKIFKFYLKNTRFINNWDLVDISCRDIVGWHLFNRDRRILYKLVKSSSHWNRRIAIVSTFYFLANGQFTDTLWLAEILLSDRQDLIHKAVGWALREVGKIDQRAEKDFLEKHIKQISRTTLRYAIEHFPEAERQRYLRL